MSKQDAIDRIINLGIENLQKLKKNWKSGKIEKELFRFLDDTDKEFRKMMNQLFENIEEYARKNKGKFSNDIGLFYDPQTKKFTRKTEPGKFFDKHGKEIS